MTPPPDDPIVLVDDCFGRYHRQMKTALMRAAADLSKHAQAEGLTGIFILADKKSQAIDVISLARGQELRDALERALKLLTPRKTAN